MQKCNCAIILAAGKGSRMKSTRPKVFQKIAGLPVVGHIIQTLQQCEVSQIITVLSQNTTLDLLPVQLQDVDIAYQQIQDGTGGAVRDALTIVKDTIDSVLILYGDTPLIAPDTINRVFQQAEFDDVHVLAIRVDDQNSYGKLDLDESNNVKGIVESGEEKGPVSNLCNVGLIIKKYILQKYINNLHLHNTKNEFFLTDIISLAYKDHFICTYSEVPAEEMQGINTMEDLADVEEIYQNKLRSYFMCNGVKLVAPKTVFFSYDTEIESDVIINPYVVFGPGVHVKKGTVIDAFCHITGASLDSSAVGPFARLRPGTKLNNGSKIGNFVEIKNSEISEGAKVNHLSYIGDAFIGSKTNIGAGTITCNYDGYNKFKTVIGKNVFIGSNTALVAPVSVGDGALIGAGSTITTDVSNGAIAVTRAEQNNIDGAAIRYHERRKK